MTAMNEFLCSVIDEATPITSRVKTSEGYLQAPATLARTGVQYYVASELGLDRAPHNMPSNKVVALYRSPAQVFDAESMDSFERQPITMNHPRPVNGMPPVHAGNWKELSVGDMVGIHKAEDGKHLAAKHYTIRDTNAIAAVDAGKKALSNGYTFQLQMTSGVDPESGVAYDGIQTKIRGNHSAIVDVARGGERCTIGDAQAFALITQGVNDMAEQAMTTVVMDNVSVQIAAADATKVQALITRDAANVAKLSRKIKGVKIGDAKKKTPKDDDEDDEDEDMDAGDADKVQACIDGLRAQCARLRSRIPSEDGLTKMVDARVKALDVAKKLTPTVTLDGKTTVAIQREVLTTLTAKDNAHKLVIEAVLAGKSVADASPDALQTAFNVLDTKATTQNTHAGDGGFGAAVLKMPAVVTVAAADSSKLSGRAKYMANLNQGNK
jgi:hypothetical protein